MTTGTRCKCGMGYDTDGDGDCAACAPRRPGRAVLTLADVLCAACGKQEREGDHGPGGHRFERYSFELAQVTA
jgi:hypothetical protein